MVLGLACSLLALPPRAPAQPDAVAADQATLKSAGVGTDGPALLTFLRKRTTGEKDRERIAALIQQLGADAFEAREKASRALVDVGPTARAQLQVALKHKDLEVRRRAKRALDEIGKNSNPAVLSAAVRVLAHHKPAAALEVLLNYLPSADEPEVVEEVVRALAVVGVRGGKPDALLLKALGDRLSAKRAAAAEALARAGGKAQLPALRKLLADADQGVRVRVALALVEAKDKAAVPALIDLLEKATGEDRDRVEELLGLLAGEKAPAPPPGADAAARRKYRLAWDAWWRENGAGLDLSKVELAGRMLGYTVIAVSGIRGRPDGRVYEIDGAGKVRWEIDGLRNPLFAQVVRRDRVLIAEQLFNRVSERNFKGEVLWQKQVATQLVGAQRLPNGHTFLAGRNQLIELDKHGREVLTINRPSFDVACAARDRDGQIVLITTTGRCVRLDRTGKELKSFPVGIVSVGLGTVQALPRGRVLLTQYTNSRVVEFDAAGKVVWEASVAQPSSARRLPNGNTLVTSRVRRRVVELDRTGREMWSKDLPGYALYADRR
jgi:hypothetical protein